MFMKQSMKAHPNLYGNINVLLVSIIPEFPSLNIHPNRERDTLILERILNSLALSVFPWFVLDQ